MHWYELNIKQLNSSNVLVQLGEYVKAQVGKHISQYVFWPSLVPGFICVRVKSKQ